MASPLEKGEESGSEGKTPPLSQSLRPSLLLLLHSSHPPQMRTFLLSFLLCLLVSIAHRYVPHFPTVTRLIWYEYRYPSQRVFLFLGNLFFSPFSSALHFSYVLVREDGSPFYLSSPTDKRSLRRYAGSGSRNCFFSPINCVITHDTDTYRKMGGL